MFDAPWSVKVTLPAVRLTLPVPKLPVEATTRVPDERFVPPLYVLLPLKIKVPRPGPFFVRLKAPPILPLISSVAVVPLTFIARFPVSVTGPDKVRLLVAGLEVPIKVKSPPIVTALLAVIAAPLVLVSEPPLIVNVPVQIGRAHV